jgi:hypothetical protein
VSGAESDTPPTYWYFDDSYGDHSAAYHPVDPLTTADHWPSIPAQLTCDVAFAATVGGVLRHVPKNWVAPAGTYCQIVGRWSDGDVRVRVGLSDTLSPDRKLTVDGRFPNWVVETVARRPMLASNVPARRRWSRRLVMLPILSLAIAAALFANRMQIPAWCGTSSAAFEVPLPGVLTQARGLVQQVGHTGSDAIAFACQIAEH